MDVPRRREDRIRRLAELICVQKSVFVCSWGDLVHDLVREIDSLRYQAYWQCKGMESIEQSAFKHVVRRWLAMPKAHQSVYIAHSQIAFASKPRPVDLQLREGFTMLKGEDLDVELRDCRNPSVWISLEPWQKDLIRDNY